MSLDSTNATLQDKLRAEAESWDPKHYPAEHALLLDAANKIDACEAEIARLRHHDYHKSLRDGVCEKCGIV
jgi:hypothetical protein